MFHRGGVCPSADHDSFAQLMHVSAASSQRRTQTFLSSRLGPDLTPLRDRDCTIDHGLLELATLLVIAYDAADREKRQMYGQLEPNGYPFIPFSVETYGRLGKPAISFLGQLGLEAEEAGRKVSKSGFVAAAIRELSVGLCWGNYQMYRANLGLLAEVFGRGFLEGAAHPTEEW
jgi:hypothetical protein